MIEDLNNLIYAFAREKDILELEAIFIRTVLDFAEHSQFHPTEYQLQEAVLQEYDFSEYEQMLIDENFIYQIAVAFGTESYFD